MAAVANADPNELLPILMQAQPNKARLEAKDEQRYKEKLLAKARIIADSANRLWRKSADMCKPKFPFGFANRQQKLKCENIWRRNEVSLLSTVQSGQTADRHLINPAVTMRDALPKCPRWHAPPHGGWLKSVIRISPPYV